MKLVGIVFAFVVGAYFVVRAIVEVVTLDYGDAASYETGLGRTVVARRARRALPAWRHLPRTHDLGRTTSPPAHQPLTTPTTGWSTHPERRPERAPLTTAKRLGVALPCHRRGDPCRDWAADDCDGVRAGAAFTTSGLIMALTTVGLSLWASK